MSVTATKALILPHCFMTQGIQCQLETGNYRSSQEIPASTLTESLDRLPRLQFPATDRHPNQVPIISFKPAHPNQSSVLVILWHLYLRFWLRTSQLRFCINFIFHTGNMTLGNSCCFPKPSPQSLLCSFSM